MPFFLQKNRLSGLKVKPFILFPHRGIPYLCSLLPHRGTVSLLAPVPPQYSISACARPTAGYNIPARTHPTSGVKHSCPRTPYRGIQYSRSYLPYQRGTIFPLIPDKGNFYCQSESPCLFSLSRKNFYKKSGFAASRAA